MRTIKLGGDQTDLSLGQSWMRVFSFPILRYAAGIPPARTRDSRDTRRSTRIVIAVVPCSRDTVPTVISFTESDCRNVHTRVCPVTAHIHFHFDDSSDVCPRNENTDTRVKSQRIFQAAWEYLCARATSAHRSGGEGGG